MIIGKAAIKIYPDTSRFREETLAKLKKELKGLDEDVNKQQRFKVDAEVQVDEQKSAKNFKTFFDKMKNQTVTVRVDVDIDEKFGLLDDYLEEMQRRASSKPVVVAPQFDSDRFEREFTDLLDETDRLSREASGLVSEFEESFDGVADSVDRVSRRSEAFFDDFKEALNEAIENGGGTRHVWDDFALRSEDVFEQVGRRYQELMDDLEREGTARELEMGLNMSEFERELQVLDQRLREIKDEYDDTDLEFHPVLDETSHRSVWARLKWLARDRIAMIHPVVNKGAAAIAERTLKAITLNATGLRTAGRWTKNFLEFLERLDKNAPTLSLVAAGIAAISGAAIAAIGSVSHLAVEFTRMAGAGLALPGILGGFAVGIGVMVAALQDFNREVPKVREDLGRMQDMISDRFWQQARVPLLDAWNTMLPSLESGFNKTADALGRWTAAMAEGLSDNLRPESMAEMFDNLAESIDIASESADDMGRILEVLGTTGSEYLPRLAEWTNDVASGFRDWLDEAERTGQLNEWIETGITKLQEFGVLVRESGELIYILGSAAERAGFSGLKEMSEGLEQVNEDLKRNQDSLDDYFEGAGKMADGFKDALGSIVDGIGEFSGTFEHISGDVESVLEDIGDAIEEILGNETFQQGVEDLFGGLSSAIEDITGEAPELAEVLGTVASTIGTVVENIGGLAAEFIEAFGPGIKTVIEDLEDPISTVADGLSDVLDALSGGEDGDFDILAALGKLVGWAVGGALERVGEDLSNIADGIEMIKDTFSGGDDSMFDFSNIESTIETLEGFIDTLTGWSPLGIVWDIIGWATDMAEEFGKGIGMMWRWVKVELDELWNKITNWFSETFTNDEGEFSITEAIENLLGIRIASFDEIFTMVKTDLDAAWQNFKIWLGELFGVEGGDFGTFNIFDAVKNLLGIEDVDFSTLFDGPKEKLSEAWNGFTDGLGELFGGGGAAGSLADGWDLNFRLNATDNATPVVDNAGWNMFEWANEKYEAILDAMDNTGGPVSDARNRILTWANDKYEAGLEAVNETASGISRARSAIRSWMNGKYDADLEATNRTGPGISSARSSILARIVNATFRASVSMNPYVSGLSAVVAKIRAAVRNFTANIRAVMPFASGGSTPRPSPPPRLREAHGGVLAFANGGLSNGIARGIDRRIRYATEHHVAQIAPAGAMRLWAEPETGGEAYIPLSESKRARSTAILSDVADRFGYSLQKYANGSDATTGTRQTSYGGNQYTVNVQTLRPDVASEVTGDVMFHLKHLAYGGGRQHGF